MVQRTPSLGLRYREGQDAPDIAGATYDLAFDLDGALGQGDWAPALGGSGFTGGSSPQSEGTWTRHGRRIQYDGRYQFGSGGSFGNGTPVIGNVSVGGNLNPNRATGHGHYYQGNTIIPILLVANYPNENEWVIRRVRDAYTDLATGITVQTGDQLRISIGGILR